MPDTLECKRVLTRGGKPLAADPVFDGLAELADAIRSSGPGPELDDCPDLPERARDILLDRLEAGSRDGTIKAIAVADHPECPDGFRPILRRHLADLYADVLLCLVPEDFEPPPPPARPLPILTSPPGSQERITSYAERATRHIPLRAAADADPRRDDTPGLRIRPKTNGAGDQVIGWEQKESPVKEAGMYRSAGGKSFELN